jgi:hypothetical protein
MSLFSEDDPPPAPYIPPPPPPPEMLDVIDEVTGTQTVTVTGSDGKKRRVIQKLPRTPEEENLYQEAGRLMDKAIGEMKRLYDYDPRQLVHYAPFVESINALNQERAQDMAELTQFPDFNGYVSEFRDMQRSIIDEGYRRESNILEETLAHKGLSDSTVAREERNLLNRNAMLARQRAGVEAQVVGEQMKGADLANRANAFSLREAGRQGRLSAAATEYDLQKDYAAQVGQQRDRAIAHQARLYDVAAGIRETDNNKAMSTMAPNMALAEFTASGNNALNFYNAQVDRTTRQYDMDLAAYKAQPPGFGKTLLQLGGMGAMAMMSAPSSSVLGGWGSKLFGGMK